MVGSDPTSDETVEIYSAAVVTISDSSFRGEKKDASGPAVAEFLRQKNFIIATTEVVPDETAPIQEALVRLSAATRLVVTTGGTGIAKRDVTPEATRGVCDRLIEGIPERMRAEGLLKTPFAVLSRAVCGVRGKSLLLNLPGSPKGAVESLAAVIDLLPHVLDLLAGKTQHGKR